MRLDISKMLTPNRAPFYGIFPGNAATPLGSVVLPVTFGMKDNYRMEYIKFEVADFKSSYHAYTTISFGLKNAGATYHRTIQLCLADQLDRNVEAYVDDVVIKTRSHDEFILDLEETFNSLRKF
jgi:hypothetical protein